MTRSCCASVSPGKIGRKRVERAASSVMGNRRPGSSRGSRVRGAGLDAYAAGNAVLRHMPQQIVAGYAAALAQADQVGGVGVGRVFGDVGWDHLVQAASASSYRRACRARFSRMAWILQTAPSDGRLDVRHAIVVATS